LIFFATIYMNQSRQTVFVGGIEISTKQ